MFNYLICECEKARDLIDQGSGGPSILKACLLREVGLQGSPEKESPSLTSAVGLTNQDTPEVPMVPSDANPAKNGGKNIVVVGLVPYLPTGAFILMSACIFYSS